MWEIFSGLIPVLEVSQGDDRVTRHTLYNLASMHLLYCLSLIFESQDDTLSRQILGQSVVCCTVQAIPKHAFKVSHSPTCLKPMSLRGIKPGSLWLTVNHSNH